MICGCDGQVEEALEQYSSLLHLKQSELQKSEKSEKSVSISPASRRNPTFLFRAHVMTVRNPP
jgi:hypothetical protein